jgi:hypothetical protein
VEERVRRIEKNLEMKEREKRRKNLIIKVMEVGEGKRKEAVQGILEKIGAKVELEEVKLLAKEKEGNREMEWIKLKSEEQKREVLDRRRNLRGERERVLEDWTCRERKMRWKLEEIAREEMREGRRTWLAYGKIRIGEQWWRWNEEEEVLRDNKGNVKRRERANENG